MATTILLIAGASDNRAERARAMLAAQRAALQAAIPILAADIAARAIAKATGCAMSVIAARPWSSITFSGHRLVLECAKDVPAGLEELEVEIPGQILADIQAVGGRRIEALTVDFDER